MVKKFRSTHVAAFWHVTPCGDVVGYRRFGGPGCLCLHHISTRRHNPEDGLKSILGKVLCHERIREGLTARLRRRTEHHSTLDG